MIRVADYIIRKLEGIGIHDVFMVVGGAAMYLNEAIGRSDKIRYICNHHEQASGWSPQVSLDEGLRRTVAWYRENRGRYYE